MGNTTNDVGSNVTAVTVVELAGLNTLGISMARIDFAPWGINPSHTHPRATEILTVIEGSVITIANAVFGSNPGIAGDILAKAFQVDIKVVQQIQSKF
ncbi:hypothetical protein M8C21_021118 [Ambrosia artemisiifolia]|uniref:Cupin type-1 domain-containing protein n=1 Tax=Ambrosia artemisiifolia TaxID=4212 RepID=A0AAD5BW78_AMBAR|nr:hypothetical protein M8C21_021118 [Ambrosia artemisiifolia]